MSTTTGIPAWVAIAVLIATPILAFAGVLMANVVTRKGAKELEARSRREEMMRQLRWAAERAVSPDAGEAALGLAQLRALDGSAPEDADVQGAIDAALESVISEPEAEIEEAQAAGDDVQVVLTESIGIVDEVTIDLVRGELPEVPSEPEEQEETRGQGE